MASWTNPIDYVVGQSTCVPRFDERILDNINFAGSHGHSGSVGDGTQISASQISGANANQYVYQYIVLPPFMPYSKAAANANAALTDSVIGGEHRLNNATGASSNYLVSMDKGTWSVALRYRSRNDGGIVSVCHNGTLSGCADTYNVSGTCDVLSAASNFTVSASGEFTLKLEVTGSNVSSIGKFCSIELIELRRLSA